MPDEIVPAPRPRRRRDDDELEQMRELLRVESEVVGKLAQRINRNERILTTIADVHFEDMNPRQKGTFIPMADNWLDVQGERQKRRVSLESWVRIAAILQGVTAVILMALAIYSFVRR